MRRALIALLCSGPVTPCPVCLQQTFHALQPAFVAIYDFQTARFVAFASCASDDAAGALALASVQLCPLACDSIAARCASNLAPLRLQQVRRVCAPGRLRAYLRVDCQRSLLRRAAVRITSGARLAA